MPWNQNFRYNLYCKHTSWYLKLKTKDFSKFHERYTCTFHTTACMHLTLWAAWLLRGITSGSAESFSRPRHTLTSLEMASTVWLASVTSGTRDLTTRLRRTGNPPFPVTPTLRPWPSPSITASKSHSAPAGLSPRSNTTQSTAPHPQKRTGQDLKR